MTATRPQWTREAIVTALAAKYGPHKAYSHETRSYEPDGNDAEGSCMVSEPYSYEDTFHLCPDDGPCDCKPVVRTESTLRSLTYGEIADALTGDRQ